MVNKNNENKLLTQRARELRKKPTHAERFLWQYLRNSQMCGCKFRRQEVLGSYIADFVCFEPKLVIELDGGQHVEQSAYDAKRTEYMESLGYKVIRFWNDEVVNQTDSVLETIYQYLEK